MTSFCAFQHAGKSPLLTSKELCLPGLLSSPGWRKTCHWGRICDLNPLGRDDSLPAWPWNPLRSQGWRSFPRKPPGCARGCPEGGSVLPAAGLVAEGGFGRKFWEEVLGEILFSPAYKWSVFPDCILNFELIRFPRGKEGCLIV